VACQQEHDYPPGQCGVIVTEYEYKKGDRLKIDYLPFFTDHCDFCVTRLARDESPACVKSCQAACMKFDLIDNLSAEIKRGSRAVLFSHFPQSS
jgi:anaerobic dimethyl sulfoxide reductase subunit B (iron-sulfur subunit)